MAEQARGEDHTPNKLPPAVVSDRRNAESGEYLITKSVPDDLRRKAKKDTGEQKSAPPISPEALMMQEIHKKHGFHSVSDMSTTSLFTGHEDLAERIEGMTEAERNQFVQVEKAMKGVLGKGLYPLMIYSSGSGEKVKQRLVLLVQGGKSQQGNPIRGLLDFEQVLVPSIQHALPSVPLRRIDILLVQTAEYEKLVEIKESKEARDRFLDRIDQDSSIQKAVVHVVRSALRLGASDIHIEPNKRGKYDVRFRVNGVLQQRMELLDTRAKQFLSRLKVMSGSMRVEEKRFDQDGRVVFSADEIETFFPGESELFHRLSLRVATVPALGGEAVTLRLLRGSQKERLNLAKIGFAPHVESGLLRSMKSPNGMILVTGPTGSGKTTSLYALLSELNDGSRCIVTAENPIEMPLEGIRQVQVNSAIRSEGSTGEPLSFARILRSFLRQDPDVILVGEIRDEETAEIALSASLTGHLVFATLHTNDSFSTVQRLGGLGVSGPELHDALRSVLSQRLVRCLCGECKEPYDASKELKELLGDDESLSAYGETRRLFRASGKTSSGSECGECKGSGYSGRQVIAELWVPGDDEKAMIARGEVAVHELSAAARRSGFKTMADQAVAKLRDGEIDLRELLKVADAHFLSKNIQDVMKILNEH